MLILSCQHLVTPGLERMRSVSLSSETALPPHPASWRLEQESVFTVRSWADRCASVESSTAARTASRYTDPAHTVCHSRYFYVLCDLRCVLSVTATLTRWVTPPAWGAIWWRLVTSSPWSSSCGTRPTRWGPALTASPCVSSASLKLTAHSSVQSAW